ncbi:hypothetical protein AaE_002050 [Aphanomyces astaci]|uniref:PI3K/PI4K catalytic domain-containing protein n=1 Tax=Aphanomyces astaci TaxID=112090 RepID=A0A6A5AVF5_APHAT|nr:hypothetical protein AaE_002050 [Aphanomyces astaci]
MVTLQLFGLMQQLWRDANIPVQLQLYECVATSPSSGVVEVVGDAITTAAIHKEGGVLGPMQDMRFAKWLETQNASSPKHYMQALDLFRRSAAGYCVATHVLGIGDRHNDNIMMNFKRDQTSFVFTKEMAFALGGTESPFFATFVALCGRALNELRQHVHLISTWLTLMVPANMLELQDVHDIYHVVEALVMGTYTSVYLTPTEAALDFAGKIHTCLGDPYKRIDNTIHNLVHLLRP